MSAGAPRLYIPPAVQCRAGLCFLGLLAYIDGHRRSDHTDPMILTGWSTELLCCCVSVSANINTNKVTIKFVVMNARLTTMSILHHQCLSLAAPQSLSGQAMLVLSHVHMHTFPFCLLPKDYTDCCLPSVCLSHH